jgi:oxidoreductase AflX
MRTYALLGATGSTGSSVLRCLLSQHPADVKLNILVRSKSKLLKAFPRLENTSAPTINIVEGTSTDTAALSCSLENADVVFMCVATNKCKPGMSIAHDTAAAIVDNLKGLRQSAGGRYKTPAILQLRSAAINPSCARQAPGLVGFCLHHLYVDLQLASNVYESAAKESPVGLLDYIFIDPPALHDTGSAPTGYELVLKGKQSISLSYADLGAAMCEVAERRAEFRGEGVLVSATGKVKEEWPTLIGYLVRGGRNRIVGSMGF